MADLKVMMFTSVCVNYWHDLPVCAGKLIQTLRRNAGIMPDLMLHTSWLESAQFAQSDVCVFYTFGLSMTPSEQDSLLRYVRSGKGFVGIHTATCAADENRPYLDMVGGRFKTHAPYGEFAVHIEDNEHPVTRGLQDFRIMDELYVTEHVPDIHVLATAEHEGKREPMAWTRSHGRGRVAYLTFGHGMEAFENPTFFELARRAIEWAGRKAVREAV